MIKLDISILWNIINILVLFLILKKFLIGPILAVIEKRQSMIDEGFETAQAKQQDADKLKGEYTEKLAGIDQEAEMIITKAQTDMALAYERTLKEAQEQAAIITKNAEETAAREKQQAISEAQEHIASLVMDATEKLVADADLSNTNQQAYEDFIRKAGAPDDTEN